VRRSQAPACAAVTALAATRSSVRVRLAAALMTPGLGSSMPLSGGAMLAMSHSPGARLRPAPAAAAGSAAAGFGRPRCTGSASGRVASGSRKRGRALAAPSTASGSGSSAGALAASSWSTRRRSASRRRRTALSSLRPACVAQHSRLAYSEASRCSGGPRSRAGAHLALSEPKK